MRAVVYMLVLYAVMVSREAVYAQSPVFSQYYSSSLFLNPSLAGIEKDIFMGMNYRSQWSNLGLPFSTFQFSFIRPIIRPGVHAKHLGGFGASFLNDVAGSNREFVNQSITVAGAYNFHLTRYGNNILSVGLQAGALQQRVNYDALQWSTQYTPSMGYDNSLLGESGMLNSQVFSPTLNAGIMWYYTSRGRLSYQSTSLYSGLSVSNILRPASFFEHRKGVPIVLYKLHGGFSSILNRKYEVSPNYLIQYQNQNFQVNVGAYVSYYINPLKLNSSKNTKIMIGAWYRLQDAFILSLGFSSKSWNFGFSYDTNVSSFGRNLGFASTYEVSLAYKIVLDKGFKRFSSPLI